jgi:hypothetical protein
MEKCTTDLTACCFFKRPRDREGGQCFEGEVICAHRSFYPAVKVEVTICTSARKRALIDKIGLEFCRFTEFWLKNRDLKS